MRACRRGFKISRRRWRETGGGLGEPPPVCSSDHLSREQETVRFEEYYSENLEIKLAFKGKGTLRYYRYRGPTKIELQ
jgi:hypothetical protein